LNKLRKFITLTVRDKFLFLEPLSWLILAKLVLIFLPFKRILPLLKQKKSLKESSVDIISIRDAIARASIATPWLSTCLLRSIAARWMLNVRKINSKMYIGMARNKKNELVMHAYISSIDVGIVAKIDGLNELYLFE